MPLPTISEPILLSIVGVLGIVTGKVIDKIMSRKHDKHLEELDLRKELREEVIYLNEKINKLETELEALKAKYWEDIELIYELKTQNMRLTELIRDIREEKETFEEDTGEHSRRSLDNNPIITPGKENGK